MDMSLLSMLVLKFIHVNKRSPWGHWVNLFIFVHAPSRQDRCRDLPQNELRSQRNCNFRVFLGTTLMALSVNITLVKYLHTNAKTKLLGDILQTPFSNTFCWMPNIWFKFHWRLFRGIQLTKSQQALIRVMACCLSHYLNQWCSSSVTT